MQVGCIRGGGVRADRRSGTGEVSPRHTTCIGAEGLTPAALVGAEGLFPAALVGAELSVGAAGLFLAATARAVGTAA